MSNGIGGSRMEDEEIIEISQAKYAKQNWMGTYDNQTGKDLVKQYKATAHASNTQNKRILLHTEENMVMSDKGPNKKLISILPGKSRGSGKRPNRNGRSKKKNRHKFLPIKTINFQKTK